MTRIDFYLLPSDQPLERLQLACRLTEKAWRQGYSVRLELDSAEQAQRLDKLLWSFKEDAFIPHAQAPGNGEPVLIALEPATNNTEQSESDNTDGTPQLLIRLSGKAPEQWQSMTRVAELISEEPEVKAYGREHYRYYQSQGIKPHLHHLRG